MDQVLLPAQGNGYIQGVVGEDANMYPWSTLVLVCSLWGMRNAPMHMHLLPSAHDA